MTSRFKLILLIATLGMSISICCFYIAFIDKPLQNSDLVKVEGTMQKTEQGAIKNYYYTIWLKEYPCSFRVSNVDIKRAVWDKFVQSTTTESHIKLYIEKADIKKLKTSTDIYLCQLCADEKAFINLKEYNEAQHSNAQFGLILGCAFLALTILVIIILIKM